MVTKCRKEAHTAPTYAIFKDKNTHALRIPTYFAVWMSRPLAYLSIPQTPAPSHRAQVFFALRGLCGAQVLI